MSETETENFLPDLIWHLSAAQSNIQLLLTLERPNYGSIEINTFHFYSSRDKILPKRVFSTICISQLRMTTAVVIQATEIAPFSLQLENSFSIVTLVINSCFLPPKATVYEIHKGKMAILTLLSSMSQLLHFVQHRCQVKKLKYVGVIYSYMKNEEIYTKKAQNNNEVGQKVFDSRLLKRIDYFVR